MPTSTVMRGRLTCGGEPLAGWTVQVRPLGVDRPVEDEAACRTGRSGGDGAFVLDRVASGVRYLLAVFAPERRAGDADFLPAHAVACVAGADVEVDVPRDRLTTVAVAGQVVDETGEPIRDARVQLFADAMPAPIDLALDPGGRFAVPRLPPGRYLLKVEHRDRGRSFRPVVVQPEPPQRALAPLVVGRPRALRVAVWAGREPVAGAHVLVLDPAGREIAAGRSDAAGLATIGAVDPRAEQVLVFGPRFAVAKAAIPPPGAADDILVPVHPALPCRLRLPFVAAGSAPAGPARFLLESIEGELLRGRLAAKGSEYRLVVGLAPGPYRLRAASPWGARADDEFEVPAEARGHVEVLMPMR